MQITLTRFQREEVSGLLDVCHDEWRDGQGDPEWEPWGVLDGNRLTVTRRVPAIEDLEFRADFLVSEGEHQASNGHPGARSLQKLADAIRASSG